MVIFALILILSAHACLPKRTVHQLYNDIQFTVVKAVSKAIIFPEGTPKVYSNLTYQTSYQPNVRVNKQFPFEL